MKKEIRLYFNLTKDTDNLVYEYLTTKKSASSYIIDLINEELNSKEKDILIAHKLEKIAEAINNIQTFNLIPSEDIKITKEELELKLNDNFDDDY